jgi:MoxR-like ATPase
MRITRHRIDASTSFSGIDYQSLQETREIEDSNVDPIAKENPPKRTVPREPYLADEKLMQAVDLAIALGRPLLLQGEPGCGKTQLAYAVSYALGLPLEVSPVKSTSRAQDLLYTYDAINRLYDAQLGGHGPKAEGGDTPRVKAVREYISLGPLGRAIARATYGRRSVVLIDEIDKADLDFPNDLLWELDRLAFTVPEAPDMSYEIGDDPSLRPIVLVTHNEEKALPAAFLRRCVFHYVGFPEDEEQLHKIIKLHQTADPNLNAKEEKPLLTNRASEVLMRIRELDLHKKPGLSELLDWVGYLRYKDVDPEALDEIPHSGALLKHESDRQHVLKELASQRPSRGE